jgi:hypothetical protein
MSSVAEAGHLAVRSAPRLTAGLLLLDTDYETRDDWNVEGELLVLGYKAQANSHLSLGAGLGLMLDGEIRNDGKNGDGEGLRLFAEADLSLHRSGANEFLGHLALVHDRFDFDEYFEVEERITELSLGGTFLHKMQAAALYAGLYLFLLSNGDLTIGSAELDFEREDRLGLRLGMSYAVSSQFDVRGEFQLLGQQNLLLMTDIRL